MFRLRREARDPSPISLGDRAREAGQWEAAARHYRTALLRNPKRAAIWVQYGHALKESGKFVPAEAAYRRAIDEDPADADVHLQLGHVLKLQGRTEEATGAYRTALALDGALQDAAKELAALGAPVDDTTAGSMQINGKPPGARHRRRKASIITRADRARDLGEWETAAQLYRGALERNPKQGAIWAQYGHVLKESGQLHQAETAYHRALLIEPSAAALHVDLGRVLKAQGQTEEAGAAYLRGLALNSTLQNSLAELSALGWSDAEIDELETVWPSKNGTDRRQSRSAYIEPLSETADSQHDGPTEEMPRHSVKIPDVSQLRDINPRGSIAVVLHLFDASLWDEMRDAIANIPCPFDLFVSITTGHSDHMRGTILNVFPHAYVFEFEDHGRDVGAFLVFLHSGILFKYDLVCKLHTKRSPQRLDGDAWRRALIAGVLGSPALTAKIISSFRADPDLGMVVADNYLVSGSDYWGPSNRPWLVRLLPLLGLPLEVEHCTFPAGNIFWIRSSLLRRLERLDIGLQDFEPEPLILDGALGHAIERIFGLLCHHGGMRAVQHGELTTSLGTDEENLLATVRASTGRRLDDERQVISESGLFDADFYRARCPDLPSHEDPVNHYLERGTAEHRDPNPLFVTKYYLSSNPGVTNLAATGLMNPFVHFLQYGWREGRNPHPLFHVNFYLRHYPDVAGSGVNPLAHFINYGAREGRISNPAGHCPLDNYGVWEPDTQDLPGALQSFPSNPLISVVMPLYATKPLDKDLLTEAIRSLQAQTYANWELCICNDGSTELSAVDALDRLREDDHRIYITSFDLNRGISAATNAALAAAQGEFVAFMDDDDLLAPNALYEIVKAINTYTSADVLYTDQDKINTDRQRIEPFHKPAWSPELFRGVMYVGHLLVARRTLVEKVGGLDSRFDKVQDFELMLRLGEVTNRIVHIPKILYHWRMIPGSVAFGHDEKDGISELQAAAVQAQLDRLGVAAAALVNREIPHRVRIIPKPLVRQPRVSILLFGSNAVSIAGCTRGIRESTYPNYEILVVETSRESAETKDSADGLGLQLLAFSEPGGLSRLANRAVERAAGEYVVFLDASSGVITTDWLEQMLFYLLEFGDVGAIGPLLIERNGSIGSAGLTVAGSNAVRPLMRSYHVTSDGYAGSLSCAREVAAVPLCGMMVSRRLFLELGGFLQEFAVDFQEVDLCMRLRKRGFRIIVTPSSQLGCPERVTAEAACDPLDRDLLGEIWQDWGEDCYYNPNFECSCADYQLRVSAVPPWRA